MSDVIAPTPLAFVIQLEHEGTGEQRTVPVVMTTPTGLYVQWGAMSGQYKLDLRTNRLVGAEAWRAADIDDARRVWRNMRQPSFSDKLAEGVNRRMARPFRGKKR